MIRRGAQFKMICLLGCMMLAFFVFFAHSVTPVEAATDPFKYACDKVAPDAEKPQACRQDGSNPISGPSGVLMSITNAIALIAGIVAVIMIIIGGFQFVFSRGDPQKAANARNTIVYAVVGIIVIAISRSIVAYVITRV